MVTPNASVDTTTIGGSKNKVGKAYVVPGPVRCKKGPWIKARCVHGNIRRGQVPCGERERCQICAARWSARVRHRIVEGAREAGQLWFVTITACSHRTLRPGSSCGKCGSSVDGISNVDDFLQAWKRLRKALWADDRDSRWFRVLEETVEKKTGRKRVHLHMVTDSKRMVRIQKPLDKEKLGPYWKKQTPEGQELIGEFIRAGFGVIADSQPARSGPSGIGRYFTKYLSKGSESIPRRADGRSVRVAEGSRNWTSERRVAEYMWSKGTGAARGVTAETACQCGKKHATVAYRDACRKERHLGWMGQLRESWDGCLQLLAKHKAREAAVRAGVEASELWQASAEVRLAQLRLQDRGCWLPMGWLLEQERNGTIAWMTPVEQAGLDPRKVLGVNSTAQRGLYKQEDDDNEH